MSFAFTATELREGVLALRRSSASHSSHVRSGPSGTESGISTALLADPGTATSPVVEPRARFTTIHCDSFCVTAYRRESSRWAVDEAQLTNPDREVRSLRLDKEWWRTVRFAIAEERRTARLIAVLIVVGVIVGTLIMMGQGVTVRVG
ncbi:hypothetical protein F3K20_03970 [Streptomyces scabiei]|uniref:hypothetical protein n=1 Tax=Streptomyces scabiei TaxID=1930 RepID=UPI00056C71C1|nr:hypothetical protein [Streptomyces sp. LBUM 1477]MBP5881556.1 hypothetical protein [Streptomyces sp. LBUM 1487]MBP5895570.1 hypothetical protein [Streptomyces sp. LBUM 1481]MBP5897327.1 hypothetical protein [Streptomyces sp. LBUM 1488]MBP5925876.1 hypothetical protein [Streptomyces sp. LBUM 1483]QTU44136.1 hypothetical protein F3K20_03970 [Streptomyces sp. LBUM 1482]